jgi:hypothetical protein
MQACLGADFIITKTGHVTQSGFDAPSHGALNGAPYVSSASPHATKLQVGSTRTKAVDGQRQVRCFTRLKAANNIQHERTRFCTRLRAPAYDAARARTVVYLTHGGVLRQNAPAEEIDPRSPFVMAFAGDDYAYALRGSAERW